MAEKKITPKRPGGAEDSVPLSRVTERPEEERKSLTRKALTKKALTKKALTKKAL